MKFHLIVSAIFLFFLRRRYRVEIIGEEFFKRKGAKLVLPNHPAQIDAQLLGVISSKYWDVVPVVSERFVNMPVIGYFMRKLNAVPVSDLSLGKRDVNVLKNVTAGVINALENDGSVILYPAGSIKLTALERIGNKQGTHKILNEIPENVPIIGVKIIGLWGSMWSTEITGKKPNFGLTLLKGFGYMFANLIFLVPKRKVTIEFTDISLEIREKAKLPRREFNQYLESFYNSAGPEPVQRVRHLFFLPK